MIVYGNLNNTNRLHVDVYDDTMCTDVSDCVYNVYKCEWVTYSAVLPDVRIHCCVYNWFVVDN